MGTGGTSEIGCCGHEGELRTSSQSGLNIHFASCDSHMPALWFRRRNGVSFEEFILLPVELDIHHVPLKTIGHIRNNLHTINMKLTSFWIYIYIHTCIKKTTDL